jgi:hypothetical protein
MPMPTSEQDAAFAALFYKWQCAACLLWWLLVFIRTKRPSSGPLSSKHPSKVFLELTSPLHQFFKF